MKPSLMPSDDFSCLLLTPHTPIAATNSRFCLRIAARTSVVLASSRFAMNIVSCCRNQFAECCPVGIPAA